VLYWRSHRNVRRRVTYQELRRRRQYRQDKRASVSKLAITNPRSPYHLKEGTVLIGTATEGPNGTITVRARRAEGDDGVPMDSNHRAESTHPSPSHLFRQPDRWRIRKQPGKPSENASMLGDFVLGVSTPPVSQCRYICYGDNAIPSLHETERGRLSWTSLSPNVCSGSHSALGTDRSQSRADANQNNVW